MSDRGDLPEFERPPLIETVLGVQFLPIKGWGIPHFGLFWKTIQSEYPEFDVQPPLDSFTEEFGQQRLAALKPRIELISKPEVRCWFISHDKTRLLQLQDSRLHHNWRVVSGSEIYPRYSSIFPSFLGAWDKLSNFLHSENLPNPDIQQCEVTYINHLIRGEGWDDFGNFKNVFSQWSGSTTDSFLPAPESIRINTRYVMGDGQGRLHIDLTPAIRSSDGRELLQLTITARGRPMNSSREAMCKWLNLGHEWVVRGFADVTSGSLQSLWKRKK